jgi:predicted house-cleaning noncanonical NTP pyrophosphatase (MazG superfamily)
MLVRDKVGEEIKKAIEEVADSDVELQMLTNEEFFDAIILKIRSELDVLEQTKSLDSLAEIMELVDWVQVALGTTNIQDVIQNRADKLGLYWKKYYIKEKAGK